MLVLSLFLAVFYITTVVKGDCIALTRSTVCSAFSQFYIGLPELSKDFPFLINTTTIEEFDERLLEYVNSTSAYLFPLGCLSSNFNKFIPYARYSLTRLCAGVIQNSNSLPCNFDNDLTPPPLCKTTCFEWVYSVTEITNNPRVCAASSQRNTTLDYFVEQCNTWQGYNGTVNDNCISGIANEPYTCGFGNNTKHACRYCANNPNDECCQSVSCNHPLSGGTITGIVVGSVVFVAIVLLAMFYIHKRRRGKTNQKLNHSTTSSSTVIAPENSADNKLMNSHETASLPGRILPPPLSMSNLPRQPSPVTSPFADEFYVVVHPYPPQLTDELELNIGDIICLAIQFDDGWALGFNVTSGLKGAFPIVCITPAPKESLDRLLNMDEFASVVSKEPYNNDLNLQLTMEEIISNTQRSINLNSYDSLHHSIKSSTLVPHRTGSLRSIDNSDVESPISPTVNTPFFDSLRKNNPSSTTNP